MPKTSDSFVFPMTAIGKVHIGEREYAPGKCFDAETIDNVNYLKMARAASVGDTSTETEATAYSPTAVDKMALGQAERTEFPKTEPLADAGARGTTDEQSPVQSGRGRNPAGVQRR